MTRITVRLWYDTADGHEVRTTQYFNDTDVFGAMTQARDYLSENEPGAKVWGITAIGPR